jgi:carbamoyltransferase
VPWNAVTHVDYSARIQTVLANTNTLFHDYSNASRSSPVALCVRGEPIVCTPEDAFRCFIGNDLDLLVVGRSILHKSAQDTQLKKDYSSAFELD